MLVPLVWKWLIPFPSAVGGSEPVMSPCPKGWAAGAIFPHYRERFVACDDCRAVGYKCAASVLSFVSIKEMKKIKKGRTEAVCAKA